MNMPLELGLYIGCRQYNPDKKHRDKKYLVFEGTDYNLKKSLSDLGGQDVKSHNNDTSAIIQGVCDWLNDKTSNRKGGLVLPHAPYLKAQFDKFRNDIPALCTKLNWSESTLTYADYLYLASPWITATIISTRPRHASANAMRAC